MKRRALLQWLGAGSVGALAGCSETRYSQQATQRTDTETESSPTSTPAPTNTPTSTSTATPANTSTTRRSAESSPYYLSITYDSDRYLRVFTDIDESDKCELVSGDSAYKGRSLRVSIPQGEHYGADFGYYFGSAVGREPEELYARYYLRFGEEFEVNGPGGKIPGFGGTYDRAGFGGRRSDGTNGWSARMAFDEALRGGGSIQLSYYVYHADMSSKYGVTDRWNMGGSVGVLNPGRWYQIGCYCKLNTPGKDDGVLRGWVDGALAYDRTDWRWRTVDSLKIQQWWQNVYYGGSWHSPRNNEVFLDNLTLSATPL